MPQVEGFVKLTAREFEDKNCMLLCRAATIYLIFSIFGSNATAYVESLTIYTGLLLACLISGACNWWKERQFLALRKEINSQTISVYRGSYGTVK